MLVSIALDHPPEHYTNLDFIQGRVSLKVPNPTNVSSIVVKLEGEARTRLMTAIRPDRPERQRPVVEVHKFLYKTQIVWPANTRPEDLVENPKASFTLNTGSYDYPFQFKIPINATCHQATGPITNISFSNAMPEFAKAPTQHVKGTLPPSLTGFPGEAEVRYFVKVTVNRPQFYKENPRAVVHFTFLPIEPPRPANADGEAYARRQHQFLENAPVPAAMKKKSIFDLSSSQTSPPSSPTAIGYPRVAVDARLPNPAILTANQDFQLRLLIKNMSERTKNIYLQMLQIELIGYTKVRAHEVSRTESNSWLLCSMSNMAIPVGSPSDAIDTEVPINPEYWAGKTVPNTVPPSFTTCNLSRHYELEVRVGLGYGSYHHGQDQLVVLPLRLPVQVFSGIAPPQALLDAAVRNAFPADHKMGHDGAPPPPTRGTASNFPGTAAQAGGPSAPPGEAPPPSYEEAVGHDLPPINGYRGNYQPPPVPEGAPRFSDEKRR